MPEVFSHMLWPLLACFVLVGIHAYLGIHVIARKVIFVDLALAQVAALGAVYGTLLGLSFEANPFLIKLISISFTLLGAVLISVTRTSDEKIPHEAIIGIIYAAALSMTILMTAHLPHGADEVRQLLSGTILWVTPSEVLYTALLYALMGLIHFVFRKQFFLLSNERTVIDQKKLNVKLWDFLFYVTFGIVVTSSVSMGGILLVFAYLVIPSLIGILLANTLKVRLLIGWASGVLMSVIGIIVSYFFELPTGPTIVVLLGLLLLAVALGLEFKKRDLRSLGFLHVILIGLISFLLVLFPKIYQNDSEKDFHENLVDPSDEIRIKAELLEENEITILNALKAIKEHKMIKLFVDVVPLLSFASDLIRSEAIAVLAELDLRKASIHLKEVLLLEKDSFIKIEMAEVIAAAGDPLGLFVLGEIAKGNNSELAQEDALIHLYKWLPDAPKNKRKLLLWLEQNRHYLRFEERAKKYYVNK